MKFSPETFHHTSVEFCVVALFPGLEKAVGINVKCQTISDKMSNNYCVKGSPDFSPLYQSSKAKATLLITYSHHMDQLQTFIPQPKTKMQLLSKNRGFLKSDVGLQI